MLPSNRLFAVLSLAIFLSYPAASQQGIVYTATVIPAIAQSGGSTTIRIQITAWTTDAEKAQLKQVFAQDGPDKGMALLRSMSKGYVNVAGQGGRKIYAAYTQESPDGKRIILVTEPSSPNTKKRKTSGPPTILCPSPRFSLTPWVTRSPERSIPP